MVCQEHGVLQVAAWLRCKAAAAAAALAAAPGGVYAATDARSLAGYAASLLGEWLPPRRLAQLQAACGFTAQEPGAQNDFFGV